MTGSGADTVGFGGFRMFKPGMSPYFDDVAYTIDVGPIDVSQEGKHLCLDSSYYRPQGYWMWAPSSGGSVFPGWDGPHCYVIGEPVAEPQITSVDPNEAEQGETFTTHIIGENTHFSAGNVGVKLVHGEDTIYCTSHPVMNDTELDADFTIPVNAPVGSYDIVVRYGEGDDEIEVRLADGFTINEALFIDVTAPVTDDTLLADDEFDITWSSNTMCEVAITYSYDGGENWNPVVTLPEPSGSYLWTVPDTPSENCLVQVCCSDESICDTSGIFTIMVVNTPPVILPVENITGCAGDSIIVQVSASDNDDDPLTLWIETLIENMEFTDNEDGTGTLVFIPDMSQLGDIILTAYASDGTDTASEPFTITVEDCTPPCSEMVLSDTVFYFEMYTSDIENPISESFLVSTPDEPFAFEIITVGADWLTLDPPEFGNSGDEITISIEGLDLEAGSYEVEGAIHGDESVCEPRSQIFTVYLDVLIPPSEDDIITTATVPAVPGSQVTMPIMIENLCELSALSVTFEQPSLVLGFDSVSFVGSIIEDWIDKEFHEGTIAASVYSGGTPVPAGTGVLATVYFTIEQDAEAGFYPVTHDATSPTFFEYDCGEGIVTVVPSIIGGGIVVGSADNYICGYVVDTSDNAIDNATVELWADFPAGTPDDITFSSASGLFEFFNSTIIPFDLYAYKEGYYPGKLEDLNFGETNIKIVLTPIEEVTPTTEWINLYCGSNMFLDEDLPVGAVIDAVANGIHCGTFTVTETGKYGFMPVYRDDRFTDEIDGALPGELIRIYVNGIEAVTSLDPVWTTNGDVIEVCLNAGGAATRSLELFPGWNLVSWNIANESANVTEVLSPIEDYLELVLGFDQGALIYDPVEPLFSSLWEMDHLSGYWIKVNQACTLEVAGTAIPATTPIPVTTGWNLVSYLPDGALAPQEALGSIHDDLLVVFGSVKDAAGDDSMTVYIPEDALSDLTEMNSGLGYWVKVEQNGQLSYPGIGPMPSRQNDRPLAAAKGLPGITPTNQWMYLYAYDLTLDGSSVRSGATVSAYSTDGKQIGSFTLEQDGLFGFMPVYADDPMTVASEGLKTGESFYLRVDGVETNEEFFWTGHASKLEIDGLTSGSGTYGSLPIQPSLSQNYPNPFNPSTTISFSLPAAGKARIEIYNILGRLVAVPLDGMTNAGHNEVVWNGTNSTGNTVASGIYFYRLTAENFTETRKMTLLK
ncbi:MAG: T9SS type A sorting domain-containing protein [candidate division Zixibacteria bacterium]|nr:T9SS type A sorting domain-containing protein [candidate division Zixibacteria bacterium]